MPSVATVERRLASGTLIFSSTLSAPFNSFSTAATCSVERLAASSGPAPCGSSFVTWPPRTVPHGTGRAVRKRRPPTVTMRPMRVGEHYPPAGGQVSDRNPGQRNGSPAALVRSVAHVAKVIRARPAFFVLRPQCRWATVVSIRVPRTGGGEMTVSRLRPVGPPTGLPDSVVRHGKLRQPLTPEHYVRRGRLLALVDDVTAAPFTLVIAPAGAGKTSLLAGWTAESPKATAATTAWLSLDD